MMNVYRIPFRGVLLVLGSVFTVLHAQVPLDPPPLEQVESGDAVWGDYDNDGDLDVLLTGTPDGRNGIAKIYRNDGGHNGAGRFVPDNSVSLAGVFQSAVAWGDYDGDNDLDILLSGTPDGRSGIARIYQNNKGEFSDIGAGLQGVFQSALSWGDYDNDGDLDILLSGTTDGRSGITRIYRNDDGAFADAGFSLEGVFQGSVAWGDYDKDGDLDILLTGTADGGSGVSKLYQNDNGNFTEVNAGLDNVFQSSVAWGDYDNDGDLDILLSGTPDGNSGVTKIYNNDAESFTDIGASLEQAYQSSVAWGDADVDGDLDILLSGTTDGINGLFNVYFNRDEEFELFPSAFDGVFESAAAWGDYDNDGDLDILLIGSFNQNVENAARVPVPSSNIYFNPTDLIAIRMNNKPAPPGGLLALEGDEAVTFTWTAASDVETAVPGLTYNLRVGLAPGGSEIVSPMANPDSGFRKLPAFGNTNHEVSWPVRNLSDGTYYWSVQTIDHGFLGSDFASGESFTIGGNLPPVVMNEIRDQILYLGGPSFTRNLEASPIIFSDPEGDPLAYSARSDNEAAATASVAGNLLTVSPRAVGCAHILVIADDGNNNRNGAYFEVTVTKSMPPVITHDPVDEADEGNDIPIKIGVKSDEAITRATLSYRRGGEPEFTTASMEETDPGEYADSIPAGFVTSRGVDYFIEVENDSGLVARQPPVSGTIRYFSIRVKVFDLSSGKSQPGGSAQTAYRMYSVPIELEASSPNSVLVDNLGNYDDTRWRFFDLPQGQERYREYPNTASFTPGRAFWLIVTDPDKVIDTGAGKSTSTNAEFSIPLNPGWTLIGNPFNFPIPVENLRFVLSDETPLLRHYRGAWNDTASARVTVMQPFEGYAVMNNAFSTDQLLVNPNLSPQPEAFAKSSASTYGIEPLWSIRILAQNQDSRDVDNLAVATVEASRARDALDYPEPPVIGEYVSVYFTHYDWNAVTQKYCTDARPPPIDGDTWEFEVKTNIRNRVRLSFKGLEDVPPQLEIWLIDRQLKISQNLREENHYAFGATAEDTPKRLEMIIGTADYLEGTLSKVQLIPLTYELFQNFPNPFNPITTIRFGLPGEDRVTLKIYDVLGREVATLVNGEQKASGYHQIIWDGRNQFGVRVASGIYIYELRSNSGLTMIKKLVLLK